MNWKEALERGGQSPDNLHSELRSAVMREDKELTEKLVKEKGIPISAFNNLIKRILIYHEKLDMLEFIKKLEKELK